MSRNSRIRRALLTTATMVAAGVAMLPAPAAHADGCSIDAVQVTFTDGSFACAGVGSQTFVSVVSIVNPSGSNLVATFVDTGPNTGVYTILSSNTASWSIGQGGLLTVV
jgi:hypothetical protein